MISVREAIYRAAARLDMALRREPSSMPRVIVLHLQHSPDRCFYCGVEFGSGRSEISEDHMLAETHGGRRTPDNIVPACVGCNNVKGCTRIGKFRRRFPNHLFWAETTYSCLLSERMESRAAAEILKTAIMGGRQVNGKVS